MMIAEWFTVQIDGAFVTAVSALVIFLGGMLVKRRKTDNRTIAAVHEAKGTVEDRIGQMENTITEVKNEITTSRDAFTHEMGRQRNDLLAHMGRNRQVLQSLIDDLVVRIDGLKVVVDGLPKSGNSMVDHPSGEHAAVRSGHRSEL